MKIHKKKKGFSLIELMLVVAIILVLLGFLVPKFSGYQSKVRTAKAINTAKQLETAAMASYGNSDGKFDTADVQECLSKLTSAESPQVSAGDSDQFITISYKSDDKNYTLEINAQENSYKVKSEDKQIFPK